MAGFRLDAKGLLTGLTGLESKTDTAIRMYAETSAKKMENYAKENRRWTDRTGHARQRLNGYVGKMANGYRVYIAHGVNYGLWLELAHEKRFAILPQTIEYVGKNQVMPGFEKLMERLNEK